MKINNLDEFLKREEFNGAFPDIMSDWKSPVEIMMGKMETKLENDTICPWCGSFMLGDDT